MSQLNIRKKTQIQVEFGKRLKNKRQELGLTQEELAEKADLDATYVGSIERGERNVSLGNIIALAHALMISPNELIPGEHHRKKEQTKVAFGKCLKSKREERGLTQEELAEKAGLNSIFIECCERGEGTISFENIIALAQALRILPKDLMSGIGL